MVTGAYKVLYGKFNVVEIAFILALFYWLKRLTVEGREETGTISI